MGVVVPVANAYRQIRMDLRMYLFEAKDSGAEEVFILARNLFVNVICVQHLRLEGCGVQTHPCE